MNLAKKDGLIPKDVNPFEGISTQDPPGQKRKLSADEIRALRDLDLDAGTPLWHARNFWLFAMYVGGMRFRDFADLRVASIRGSRLDYRMSKTGSHKSVDLPPVAAQILDHYVRDMNDLDSRVFPLLSKYDTSTAAKFDRSVASQNALVNKALKQVAAKAGVYPKLSFHQSRHSFANLALADGWSVRKIQAALGHRDIATTERYLRELDAEFTGDEMGKLFGEKRND